MYICMYIYMCIILFLYVCVAFFTYLTHKQKLKIKQTLALNIIFALIFSLLFFWLNFHGRCMLTLANYVYRY